MKSADRITSAEWLVVIALNEELQIFIDSANRDFYEMYISDDCLSVHATEVINGRCEICVACFHEMGIEAATEKTGAYLSALDVDNVLNIGFAGAIGSGVKVGDIVVAQTADNFTYNAKAVDTDKGHRLIWAGDVYRTTDRIISKLRDRLNRERASRVFERSARSRLNKIKFDRDALGSQVRLERPRIHYGPVACGPFVVASNDLKEVLKSKNRKFISVDMESAGVARAVRNSRKRSNLLVVRAISDAADSNKSLLDASSSDLLREWALESATWAVAHALWPVTEDDISLQSRLTDLAVNEYLPYPYADRQHVESIPSEVIEAFFASLIKYDDTLDSPVEWAAEKVLDSQSQVPLKIYGEQGTGKSSFLAILFWRLVAMTEDDDSIAVAYLNVQRYTSGGHNMKSENSDSTPGQSLDQHLEVFEDVASGRYGKIAMIVIIDGYDPSGPSNKKLESRLLHSIGEIPQRKAIGVKTGQHESDSQFGMPENVLGMCAVPVESRDCGSLIKAFKSLSSLDLADNRDYLDLIQQYRLTHVDPFTLSLVGTAGKITGSRRELSGLIEDFANDWISQAAMSSEIRDQIWGKASRLAFHFEVDGNDLEVDLSEAEQISLGLVRHHPLISSFLAGRYVVAEFKKLGKRKTIKNSDLKYVYPYRINRFCKSILIKDEKTQADVLKGVGKVLKSSVAHKYAKAHAAYLAGRVASPQKKQMAINILESYMKKLGVSPEVANDEDAESKIDLLVWRTVYISLAYLGKYKFESKYVEELLMKPEWDRFNRGFHLEYYGDQLYTPGEALVGDDQLKSCPQTFDQLIGRLQKSKRYPLRSIELQTLFSLAQHRHAVRSLCEEDRKRVIAVGEESTTGATGVPAPLRSYVLMVVSHLREDIFNPVSLFMEAYGLKSEPRAGWYKRGIMNAENVASHTHGAYLIALFMLPDNPSDSIAYSKQRVISMLLIHDLAESRTGDYLPIEGAGHKVEEERAYFEDIRFAGTYKGIANLSDVHALWTEFEAGSSPDALVAKDIDKLENLIQLRLYCEDGHDIKDEDEWEAGLVNSLRTTVVKEMTNDILRNMTKKNS